MTTAGERASTLCRSCKPGSIEWHDFRPWRPVGAPSIEAEVEAIVLREVAKLSWHHGGHLHQVVKRNDAHEAARIAAREVARLVATRMRDEAAKVADTMAVVAIQWNDDEAVATLRSAAKTVRALAVPFGDKT